MVRRSAEQRYVKEEDHRALERKLERANRRIERIAEAQAKLEERVAIRTARNVQAQMKREWSSVAAYEVEGVRGAETFLMLPKGGRVRLRVIDFGRDAGCIGIESLPEPDAPPRFLAVLDIPEDGGPPDVRRMMVR